jgi:hypothetical protein
MSKAEPFSEKEKPMEVPMEVTANSESQWITKPEAARLLGVSPRTIETYVGDRKLSTKMQPVEGRRALPLINRDDVERLASEQNRGAILNSVQSPPESEKALARVEDFTRLLATILKARSDVPPALKPFMTLEEAGEYTSLPLGLLRKLIREKRLPAERYVEYSAGEGKKKKTRRTTIYVKTSDLKYIDFARAEGLRNEAGV